MNGELVSIIVPIYNLELYIEKCIRSIINQTYKNLEILLINDGSSDDSLEICERYKLIDERIVIIDKKNGGAADARNKGLDQFKGRYVTYVDGDDYVKSTYIEVMYKNLFKYNADISIVSYETDFKENKKDKKLSIIELTNIEALENLFYQKNYDSAVWCKLYKRELFENIRFQISNLYEDLDIIYKVFEKSQKVVYSNKKEYYYTVRDNGTTNMKFNIKKMDLINVCDDMKEYIFERYDLLKKSVSCRLVSANFHILSQIYANNKYKKETEIIVDNIKRYRKDVLKDTKSRRKTKIAIILSYMNFNFTCYILNKMKRV